MFQIPVQEFLNRVVSSQERIGFSFSDPYGHLSTCRYLELFVNHRILAPDEQQGITTMELVKQNIGLFFAHAGVDYLRPTFLGETVELNSWVKAFDTSGFEVFGVLYGKEKKDARATFKAKIRSVDLKTGKPVALPSTIPCRSDQLISQLPFKDQVLPLIKGIPENSF